MVLLCRTQKKSGIFFEGWMADLWMHKACAATLFVMRKAYAARVEFWTSATYVMVIVRAVPPTSLSPSSLTLNLQSRTTIPVLGNPSWLPSLQVLVPKGLIFLLTNFIHSACNTCSPFPELVYIYCTNCSRIQCYS